jgi:CRP/FNR family transcriptional regulator, nitrogen oxide reductase regulator
VSLGYKSLTDERVVGLPDRLKPRFLSGLAPSELSSILSMATPRYFPEPAVIIHQDDPAERLFLLTRGQGRQFVITSEGQKTILYWLTAGQLFGGATILSTPWQYLASTEVLPDSSVLAWDRKTIRECVSRFPILLDNALSIAVTEQIAWAISRGVSLTSDDAAGRIANLLVSLACGIGKVRPDGVEIQVGNEDLASGANVTPFTVSRALGEWQRVGILSKGRGKLLLRKPELLMEWK